MILNVRNISKQYKDKKLFDNLSFSISKGQKIALIGKNGSGKSTLLKVILGLDFVDNKPNEDYEIFINPNTKVGYIDQDFIKNDELNILELTLAASPVEEFEAKSILTKLGFKNLDLKFNTLSGGEKRKVALAITLLKKNDLLILDEPTNHLDLAAVNWLETYIKSYKGALLLVTHDRAFLNNTTNDIFELDEGKLYTHENVDFEEFLDLKAQRIVDQQSQNRKNKSMLKTETKWITRGVRARGTKSKDRIERFEKLKGSIQKSNTSTLDLTTISGRIGNKTIELNNISKHYEGKKLFEDFSFNFQKYQRIGILGKNGSGKSTLMKIIAGEIKPDSGSVVIGDTIRIAYLSQQNDNLNPDDRIIDFIKNRAEFIETIHGNISAENLLERFLFPRNMQYDKVGTLSGGEKKRLILLYTLIELPNVLMLDEPTNDFDIDTLLILEEFIENFQGIVILISHDRYFLNKVVDDFFIVNDNSITLFQDSYDEYLRSISLKTKSKKVSIKKEQIKELKEKPKKFTYKEKIEFETIDQDIEKVENEIGDNDVLMKKYQNDFSLLKDVIDNRSILEEKLENLTKRWYYLNELNEEINRGKNGK